MLSKSVIWATAPTQGWPESAGEQLPPAAAVPKSGKLLLAAAPTLPALYMPPAAFGGARDIRRDTMANKNGLFDAAKMFELFAVEVCNVWFGQKFSNLNVETATYPYVDLISENISEEIIQGIKG